MTRDLDYEQSGDRGTLAPGFVGGTSVPGGGDGGDRQAEELAERLDLGKWRADLQRIDVHPDPADGEHIEHAASFVPAGDAVPASPVPAW